MIKVFISIFLSLAPLLYATDTILDVDFSPANRSLSGRGTSLAQGSEFYISNPAQLQLIKNQEYGITYEEGLFSNRYLNIYTAQKVKSFPFAIATALLIPQNLDIISNTGIATGQANIFQLYLAFHASNKVKLGVTELWIGYGAKGLYGELEKIKYGTFVLDLSFMIPVSAKFLKIKGLKHKSLNNLFFNFTFTNFGVPIKYINASTHAPAVFDFGLNYVVLHVHSHKLDIVSGAKVYIFEGTFVDRLIPSVGLQYLLFDIAFMRFGFDYSSNRANFNVGLGFKYNIYGKYSVQADYNLGINPSLDFTHSVGFKFTYNITSHKDEFQAVEQLQQEISLSYNTNLLNKMNKIIKEYHKEHNAYPQNLKTIIALFQKQEEHDSVVAPSKGFFSYQPNFGKLKIITEQANIQSGQVEITLKDRSTIVGRIKDTQNNKLTIKHVGGLMTLNKNSIQSIESVALKRLDINIQNIVQGYVNDFKVQKKNCPASLDELSLFLSQYNIEKLPSPSQGELEYDASTCLVSLSIDSSDSGSTLFAPKNSSTLHSTPKKDNKSEPSPPFDSSNIQNNTEKQEKVDKKTKTSSGETEKKSDTLNTFFDSDVPKEPLKDNKKNNKKTDVEEKKSTSSNNEEFIFNDE